MKQISGFEQERPEIVGWRRSSQGDGLKLVGDLCTAVLSGGMIKFCRQAYDELGTSSMPNSDHPLLDQIAKLRDELKHVDKQKRKAAKLHVLEKEGFEERIAELVLHIRKFPFFKYALTGTD